MPDQQAKPEPSLRMKRQQERLQRIAKVNERQRVRVVPRDADMRRVLKHPNGMAFRSEGSIEWPLDSFTKRRLRDGSVTLEEKADADKRTQARRTESTTVI